MLEEDSNQERNCAVCGNAQNYILFQQKFTRLSSGSLMDGYDVVVCESCGFSFADNIPDQKAFDIYYHDMSKYEHQDHAGQASEFESRQFPALAHYIRRYITNPNARILEIGSANGGLLNALRQLGFSNVLGLDPSPVCARNAEELYQIRVLTSSISDFEVASGQFDFIILVAVLEHIKDLDATLTRLRELLPIGGRIYIEVPDVTHFASSPDAPFQEFSLEHINFFSVVSLGNLMNVYGFSEISSNQVSYEQTDMHTGYAVRMVFQKDHEIKKTNIVRDSQTAPALEQYVANSQAVETRIHETINELIDNQKPLIVWGVGTHTQRLLATSNLKRANIVAFVDSNPNYQDKQLNSLPIINPEQLTERSEPILVSSRIFQSEIVNQIQSKLKLENTIHTLYED